MKIQVTIGLLAMGILPNVTLAQNETDALRYSQIGFGGTARYAGMGGSFGALGGDLSCIMSNPAGMGRFTKSEFDFGLVFENIDTKTSFLNNTTPDGKGNFNLGSIGFVGTKKLDDYDWHFMQFGFAYNRTNYFHSAATISGINSTSSMLDVFRNSANGYTVDQLPDYLPNTSNLAYQTYLIDPMDTLASTSTYTDRIPQGASVDQQRSITTYGYNSETTMSFSGNYKNKLYVGGAMGLPGVRYEEDWMHTENVIDPDSLTSLETFSYFQTLNTRGRGINFKGGLIFLPVDWVRLGFSAHTPTWMSFTDTWNNRMTSRFDDGVEYEESGPLSNYSWRLKTPGKVTGSLGLVLYKMAAINIDVEAVNYKSMRLKRDWADQTGYDFVTENTTIDQNFRNVINIKAGAEVKLSTFFLRGGYAIYPSAYNPNVTSMDGTLRVISGGAGYRNHGFSIDLAVNAFNYGSDYYLYDPVLFNKVPAQITTNVVRTNVTVGWRF